MSLGGILILVLLVISLFVFIYLIVVTARSWGVLHTVMLCFLFIECWTFLFFSAQVLDRRLAILEDFTKTRDRVEALKKDVHRLTWGSDNIGEEQEALVPLAGKVRRLTADRGRVWRNVTKVNVEGERVRLELMSAAPPAVPGAEDPAAVQPDAAAAAAAPPAAVTASIPLNMVVYAFSQVPNEKNHPIPQTYLGEFKVVESGAGQVLLQPLAPVEPNQIKARDEESTWSLYELLPQDSHETFAADGSQPGDNAAFGLMDVEMLNTLFADVPETDGRRDRLVAAYLRDGQQAQDTDPPRNVWLQIEVVKPFELDVDSDEQANATIGGYFDASGRTVDVRIKRGEEKKVTLPEGKQLMLPQERANELIAQGNVKLIKPIYVRPLNAYEKGLGQLKIRRDEVARLIDVTNRETKILQDANDQGQATKQRYVETYGKMAADQEKYTEEVALVGKELQLITDKYQQIRNQMIDFYQTIHAAHDRMVKAATTTATPAPTTTTATGGN